MNSVSGWGLSGTPRIVSVQRGQHSDWAMIWEKTLLVHWGYRQYRESLSEVREGGGEGQPQTLCRSVQTGRCKWSSGWLIASPQRNPYPGLHSLQTPSNRAGGLHFEVTQGRRAILGSCAHPTRAAPLDVSGTATINVPTPNTQHPACAPASGSSEPSTDTLHLQSHQFSWPLFPHPQAVSTHHLAIAINSPISQWRPIWWGCQARKKRPTRRRRCVAQSHWTAKAAWAPTGRMTELLSSWLSLSTMWGRLSSLRQPKSLRYRPQYPLPLVSSFFSPYCLHVSQSASLLLSPFSCSLPDLHFMLPSPFLTVLVLLQLPRGCLLSWRRGRVLRREGGREHLNTVF